MQNWWDILGVERDADLRSIKRAYAAKLKSIRQDEDPQGFMDVRAAYDEAQGEIRYREAYPEEWQKRFGDVVQEKPIEDENEVHIQEGLEVDNPETDNEADNETDTASLPILPNEHYSPPVVQLMGEVEALLKSPWGAGSIESWTALMDDQRLDDIDVFADFETAMLNHLLNIHAFFDDDTNVPAKLVPAVAKLLFERFGWQEKRNSVHINPMVFDWLANKFFANGKIDGEQNVAHKNIDLQGTNYTQDHYGRKRRKPTPNQDKFTQWFDSVGKILLIGAVVLFFIASIVSSAVSNNGSTSYEELRKEMAIGSTVLNSQIQDCDAIERYVYGFGTNNGLGAPDWRQNTAPNRHDELEASIEALKKAREEDRKWRQGAEGLPVTEPIILTPPPKPKFDHPERAGAFDRAAVMRNNMRKALAICRAKEKRDKLLKIEEVLEDIIKPQE